MKTLWVFLWLSVLSATAVELRIEQRGWDVYIWATNPPVFMRVESSVDLRYWETQLLVKCTSCEDTNFPPKAYGFQIPFNMNYMRFWRASDFYATPPAPEPSLQALLPEYLLYRSEE